MKGLSFDSIMMGIGILIAVYLLVANAPKVVSLINSGGGVLIGESKTLQGR